MPALFFIRHAAPEATAALSPAEWPLSVSGVAAARALELPAGARILASNERKAIETVEIASGTTAIVDPDFGEVRRDEPFGDDFRQRRRAWIRGDRDDRHTGWETQEAAARRMTDGLRRHRADAMVVGTHGMVLTAWLVHSGLVHRGEPAAEFWEGLAFPEVVPVMADEALRDFRLVPRRERLRPRRADPRGR